MRLLIPIALPLNFVNSCGFVSRRFQWSRIVCTEFKSEIILFKSKVTH